jgi:hypothetical protein
VHHFRRVTISALTLFLLALTVTPAQAAPPPGTDPAASDLAAGWLARSLADADGIASWADGSPDYASTTYAIMGLRAAGYGSDQVTASAQALVDAGDAFIGDATQVDAKASAIALMILAMTAAGLDPTQYAPDRDLVADLESTIQPDGALSSAPSAYGQGFAIMALLSATGQAPAATVDWLAAQRCVDEASPGLGGYGFSGPGSCTDVDPDSTAVALLALALAQADPTLTDASRAYLWTTQDTSGGFRSDFSGVNAFTTGLALAALTVSAADPQAGDEAADLDAGRAWLASLSYSCLDAADPATAGLVGAMAGDEATRSANPTSPADLFGATAQGLWGLLAAGIDPVAYPAPGAEVPDATWCASAAESTDTAQPTTTATTQGPQVLPDDPRVANNPQWWIWVAGGLILVGAALLVWRLVAGRRTRP